MSLVFDQSEFMPETVKGVPLTIGGKGDKKGCLKRAQGRGYVRKERKVDILLKRKGLMEVVWSRFFSRRSKKY
jgi:hypothetical protein